MIFKKKYKYWYTVKPTPKFSPPFPSLSDGKNLILLLDCKQQNVCKYTILYYHVEVEMEEY